MADFVSAIADSRSLMDSTTVDGLTSDHALHALADRLEDLGYQVETGKKAAQ